MYPRLKDLGLAVFAVAFPLALIACTWLVAETARAVVPSNQIVKVRGVAERLIQSDRVNWTIVVEDTQPERGEAFASVDRAIAQAVDYLAKKGVPRSAIQLSPIEQRVRTRRVTLDKLGNQREELVGYEVSQRVELRDFEDLDLVEKLMASISSDLQRKGLPVEPRSPYFFFSKKVSDIKPELLKAASSNAFERATIVAESSGSQLGGLRAARQGAFEGMGSDGFVGGSSREHRISAVVTVDYSIAR
jgi:hypothetical protein